MSLLKKTGKAMADVIPGLGRLTFDASVGTVFITSGTGVIGYRVAMSLLEAGHNKIRVGVFRGDSGGGGVGDDSFEANIVFALREKGAEVVDFDWTKMDSYEEAVKGVTTVFCTIPHMDHWADCFPAFLRTCKERRVEHFIKISFLRNDVYRDNVPFVNFHATCDDLLIQAPKSSRISYTLLCTGHLMSTPLLHQGDTLKQEHTFKTASYGMGVNYVSPNDVADAAVITLLDRKTHRNMTYNISGPGPTFDSDVAIMLSKAFGTDIKHVELGYHAYKKDVQERGLPNWLVRDSAAFEKMKASGIDEDPKQYKTNDLERIIGKKPETFTDYLENKNAQRPGRTFP